MKAIKGLVLFLGLLLVAGLSLLGYGLLSPKKASKAGVPQAASMAASEFGAVSVPVPAGSHVEQMSAAGERIVIRLSGSGPERLLVIDPAQGRVSGSFVLTPEPAVR